jgi:3-hydroxybutyryl-CoA dehydrogenase
MIYICDKCGQVWYYQVKKCIYCKNSLRELKEINYTVKGMTEVFVPSKNHAQVPYFDLLLEDENGNLHVKKSFKRYEIGDTITKDMRDTEPKCTIGIVGMGVMGTGLAQILVSAGFKLVLKSQSDKSSSQALHKIEREILKTTSVEEKDALMKNIRTTTRLEDLSVADIVIESVVEDMEVKKKLFKDLGELLPKETIIASNTSSLSIDEMAEATMRPDRFVGLHFFNPVTRMALVEVIKGRKTSEATIKKAGQLVRDINRNPVYTKNSPGFIVNRILMTYLNEAMWELYEGLASAEDIDTASKQGLNHPMGPLELADLIGLDIVLNILKTLNERTKNDKYAPCPIIIEKVRSGKLGRKTGEGFYVYANKK